MAALFLFRIIKKKKSILFSKYQFQSAINGMWGSLFRPASALLFFLDFSQNLKELRTYTKKMMTIFLVNFFLSLIYERVFVCPS